MVSMPYFDTLVKSSHSHNSDLSIDTSLLLIDITLPHLLLLSSNPLIPFSHVDHNPTPPSIVLISTLLYVVCLVLMLCLFPCFVGCTRQCGQRWRLRTRVEWYVILKTRVTTPELESDQLYSRSPFRHFPASNPIDTHICCCCFIYDHACYVNPKIGSLLLFSYITLLAILPPLYCYN